MDDEGAGDYQTDAGFESWHVYDAGGPVLSLKVRCRDDAEVPGWQAYDREPGNAPVEYAIFYLKRDARGRVSWFHRHISPARTSGSGRQGSRQASSHLLTEPVERRQEFAH